MSAEVHLERLSESGAQQREKEQKSTHGCNRLTMKMDTARGRCTGSIIKYRIARINNSSA